MAFVYKANKAKDKSLADNGPGSYELIKPKSVKKNKFAFNSNSRKEFSLSKAKTPGVGEYNLSKDYNSEIFNLKEKKLIEEPPLFYKISVDKDLASCRNSFRKKEAKEEELNLTININKDRRIKHFDESEAVFNNVNNTIIEKHQLLGYDQVTNKIFYQTQYGSILAPFNVTEQRFPDPKFIYPGPGYYNTIKENRNKSNRAKSTKLKRENRVKRDAFPCTIPYKNSSFGYEYNSKNGFSLIEPVVDEKSDYYNLYQQDYDKWKKVKGGNEWSRSKTTKKCLENKERIIPYDSKKTFCMEIDREVKEKYLRSLNKLNDIKPASFTPFDSKNSTAYDSKAFKKTGLNFKYMKETSTSAAMQLKLRKTFYKMNQFSNQEESNTQRMHDEIKHYISQLDKNPPGPGYYHQDLATISDFRPKRIIEDNQNFGSSSARFTVRHKNYDIENLGPGYYNLTKERKVKVNKPEKQVNLNFNSRQANLILNEESESDKEMNELKQIKHKDEKENGLGPGAYNINKDFIKKAFSSTQSTFGSEVRFPKFTVNQIKKPEAEVEDILSKHSKITERNMFRKVVKNKKADKSNHAFGGTISSSKVALLDTRSDLNIDNHTIEKKTKQVHKINQPFNSSKQRFDIPGIDNVGPGSYIRLKKINIDDGKHHPAFNQTERRFALYSKGNSIGPADYNNSSYFDWNKKSYNINFL